MARTRRGVLAGVALTVLVALGAGVAVVLGDELGIRSEPSDVPRRDARGRAGDARPSRRRPSPSITAPASVRMGLAVDELRDAVADAGTTDGTSTLDVVVGDGGDDDETYRLDGRAGRAAPLRGIRGRSDARRLRPRRRGARPSQRDRAPRPGRRLAPRFRMVDLGAVGVAVDEPGLGGGRRLLAQLEGLRRRDPRRRAVHRRGGARRRPRGVREVRATTRSPQGYNAIAIPGFIEYLTFVGRRRRHRGLRRRRPARGARRGDAARRSARCWSTRTTLGMQVYFRTDMLALTTPLEEYLVDRFGSLATDDPEFWDVYRRRPRRALRRDALRRRRAHPHRRGRPGLRPARLGLLLRARGHERRRPCARCSRRFTEQAERVDREVIFRTLERRRRRRRRHAHERRVVRRRCSTASTPTALIVSTKYTLGDFYSHLPLNHTLEIGEPAPHRRVPEPARVRELRRAAQRPRRALPEGAAALHRREPARRGHLDLDAGRRPVARRAALARAEGRLLAALRAQHRARRAPRPRSRRRPRGDHRRLGAALVLRRPRHRAGDRRGDGARRARRSPTASTSARSPTGASSRSASSRRP